MYIYIYNTNLTHIIALYLDIEIILFCFANQHFFFIDNIYRLPYIYIDR